MSFLSLGEVTPVQYLILLIIPSVFKILLPKFVVQTMYCFHLVFSAILGKMSCQLKQAGFLLVFFIILLSCQV